MAGEEANACANSFGGRRTMLRAQISITNFGFGRFQAGSDYAANLIFPVSPV
jgi:hypothetical protein